MAIDIRLESSWDTDDGEGRRVEVTVVTRRHPSEDPEEDTRYFAAGDRERIKRYLCDRIDRHAALFAGHDERECTRCGRIVASADEAVSFVCEACRSRQA